MTQVERSKPIIGVVGGIASGKTFVADQFGQLGCLVIRSDELAHQLLNDPQVHRVLRQWWGTDVFDPEGQINRQAVGKIVFRNPPERQRLEQLLHPLIAIRRNQMMQRVASDPGVPAYVWDSPLLVETGLYKECDTIVFADAPLAVRQERAAKRGWSADELQRRENSQETLDKKRRIAQYVIDTAADSATVGSQVQAVLSRIINK